MNILFVWKSKFKDAGGVGRVTEILADQFIMKGHSVNYFSFSMGEEHSHNGINQFLCPVPGNLMAKDNINYLADLLVKKKVDVVINQTGFTDIAVLKAANQAIKEAGLGNQIKVFSVHHNCVKCLYEHFELIVQENYKKSRFYSLIKNPLVLKFLKRRHKKKYASNIQYVIENSFKLVMLSNKFIPDLKVYLDEQSTSGVEAVLNPAPFKKTDTESEKRNRLLYVGRINFQQKRTDLLVPIWKKIMNLHPDWELDVLGDGEALQDLREMAEDAGLERIHFHGFQDPKPFLRKAKYFVMTSAFEGFGMVLVEAQAYGVIPIAFNCFSAIGDIIDDGKTGVLVEPFNIADYVDKLDGLMKNEKGRSEMAKNSRQSIDKFEPGKIADKWLRMFES